MRIGLSLALVSLFVSQVQGAARGSRAKVELISSIESVVAGQAFEMGLRFQLSDGWHIYWQNPGDAGLAPRVKWTLPDGFHAKDLVFPVPKRHVAAGNIVTNVLEEEAVLLVPMIPPNTIQGNRIKIVGEVNYLICRENCIPESATVQVELPTMPAGTPVKGANTSVFSSARKALPSSSSKHVSVKPTFSTTTFAPGQSFELTLAVDVHPGFHIQSHRPLQESLIPADVLLERVSGLFFESPVFPEGKLREVKVLGQVSEYAGSFLVKVGGKVDEEPPTVPVRIGGLFLYQACNEQGTCFPPDALAFSWSSGSADSRTPALGVEPPKIAVQSGVPSIDALGAVETVGAAPKSAGFFNRFGLLGQLVACLLYGLFINATPCVMPLLSIKVLGFVQQAHESRRRTALLGLSFGAGVMLFFVVLGLLASAGTNILQFPVANIILGAVVMVMALAMLGVYNLQMPSVAGRLDAQIRQEGLGASFGKGALAPVLGIACTGPLLAGAFGWATQQPPLTAVLAFLMTGLGMAAPYMLLGANPNWLSFLPRPGAWMVTFERIMGFLLLGMVIWLLNPLVTQIGTDGFQWTLVFLVALAMSCWLYGKPDYSTPPALRRWYHGFALGVALVAGVLIFGWFSPLGAAAAKARLARGAGGAVVDWEVGIPWKEWSPEAVEQTVRGGKAVFVDFTAAYCTVCKVNKKIAVDTPEARAKMKALGVVPFQGDFSSPDERIAAMLRKHERAGVPLNLIYPPGRPEAVIVLEPNLTKSYLLEKLDEAAATRTATAVQGGS